MLIPEKQLLAQSVLFYILIIYLVFIIVSYKLNILSHKCIFANLYLILCPEQKSMFFSQRKNVLYSIILF